MIRQTTRVIRWVTRVIRRVVTLRGWTLDDVPMGTAPDYFAAWKAALGEARNL